MLWFSIIFGILSLISLVYSIVDPGGIDPDGTAEIGALSTLVLIFSIVGICYELSTKPVTHKSPANKYVLECEITTIVEESDTTYVLKIKND